MYSFGLKKQHLLTFLFSLPVGSYFYSLKTMTNDKIRIFCIYVMGCCLISCSPQYRLSRLLQNNPYLYEIFRHDSLHIRNVVSTDSVFFFTKEKDTITLQNATIYRSSDTVRIRQSCPPCTTYIAKTILQPTERITKEKGFKRSLREKLEDAILPIILGILIALLIRRK